MDEIENEEDRRIVEIVRNLDKEYGLSGSLKNALEIENWCKTNFGDKEIWNRSLPTSVAKDENEKRLGIALARLRQDILKQYEEKELENIENMEHKEIVKLVRNLDKEYGLSGSLKNALEIENWCKTNFEDKEIWNRRLPNTHAKDENETRLGKALIGVRLRILKQYEGKKLDEIENEEDRRTVEIVRRLDEEYGLGKALKNTLEIENWCKTNFDDKEVWKKRLPSKTAKDENEKRLGSALG